MTQTTAKNTIKVGGERRQRKRPTVEQVEAQVTELMAHANNAQAQVNTTTAAYDAAQLAAQPAEELSSIEKMTVGHNAIAEARAPDPEFVAEAITSAWSIYNGLSADNEALARHGTEMNPAFTEMMWGAMRAAKALEYMRDVLTTLVGVEALLTPEQRAAYTEGKNK